MPRQAKTARRKRWAYSAGARGVNRVRAFAHAKTGALYLEWKAPDAEGIVRTVREPLTDCSQDEATAAADRKAVAIRAAGASAPRGPLTLGMLFDMYLREANPDRTTVKHNERATALFYGCWGRERNVVTLSPSDIKHYIRERRAGRIVRLDKKGMPVAGKPVRDRVLEEDLTFLRTVIRWATREKKDGNGRWLLDSDPVGAFDIPREKDVRRPMLPVGEVERMLEKALVVDRRVWLALTLCHETGRRLNSVRMLRWSDLDLTAQTIRWVGERQKNGETSVTPMTAALVAALKQERRARAVISDGWLFPSSRSEEPIHRKVFYNGWAAVRTACGLELIGAAFHTQRRSMASDFSTAPLAVVAEIGGWKHPEVALKVYQQPNLEQQRSVLGQREFYKKRA